MHSLNPQATQGCDNWAEYVETESSTRKKLSCNVHVGIINTCDNLGSHPIALYCKSSRITKSMSKQTWHNAKSTPSGHKRFSVLLAHLLEVFRCWTTVAVLIIFCMRRLDLVDAGLLGQVHLTHHEQLHAAWYVWYEEGHKPRDKQHHMLHKWQHTPSYSTVLPSPSCIVFGTGNLHLTSNSSTNMSRAANIRQ